MRRGLATLTVLIWIGIASVATACTPPAGSAAAQDTLIAYTNQLRAVRGRNAVTFSDKLQAAAQAHACYMAATRKMSHKGVNGSNVGARARSAGYDWRTVAENVAFGYPSPLAVGRGWQGSPGHRRNMLSRKVTQIGIGWARADGRNYWVMVLGAPR